MIERDPWDVAPATHEPDLTPDEWVAIRDEIWQIDLDDRGLTPECLVEAFKVLGEIGMSNTDNPAREATQCLRRLVYRAKTGGWPGEQTEPAWSLDTRSTCSHPRSNHGDGRGCDDENCPRHGGEHEPTEPLYRHVLSDGDGDLG